MRDVIIIGSGPSGYTAAIYCARALLKPLMITGKTFGGQLMKTTDVENYPGFKKIKGSQLMEKLHLQAEELGTEFLVENVTSIEGETSPYKVITSSEEEFFSKSVIISTGSEALWLNAENEKKLSGLGISTCATCDGAFYKDKKIIVIGGGDTAMEDANFLTRFGEVTIVHRREGFKASKIMLKKARNNSKISWLLNKVVEKWLADETGFLEGVVLRDTKTGELFEIECGGAFIAIGHKPATEFLNSLVELDSEGYILHSKNMMTSKEGIFACGDVCASSKRYKQAITSSAEGCKAAMDCEKWLESLN
jgi:thioredoxin reductase (NADPH)